MSDFQNRTTAAARTFPKRRSAKSSKARVKMIELVGKRAVGVSDSKRKETDRLTVERVEDLEREAVTSHSSARDTESVMA